MAYVDLNTIHNPATGTIPPATWGDQIRDNFVAGVPDVFAAAGDLVYGADADAAARLPIGTASQYLKVNAGATAPEWVTGSALSLGDVYPVGSIYLSVVSTNPATLFGIGTWVAFGTGRVLVGIDPGDADFDVVEETGGSKTVSRSTSSSGTGATGSGGDSATGMPNASAQVASGSGAYVANELHSHVGPAHTHTGPSHRHTFSGNNVQPYIVCYMWKRTE